MKNSNNLYNGKNKLVINLTKWTNFQHFVKKDKSK